MDEVRGWVWLGQLHSFDAITPTFSKNTVTADVSEWFEWARRQRIVLAMSGNVVYTPDGEAVELREMMRRFPVGE
ncbi:hypothetical protein [Nostoc sp. FACHB-145]|uniref:hypothetical protein n=1 Tax=Nostoc sp. FACHB-145 TaxID=2692836 RepID=UPI0016861D01|nr:hypothetical protein [Nostoc sp. FACHB-145]MBD2471990.1 hypothetical protein [Nostoc sp. FACHB-145]